MAKVRYRCSDLPWDPDCQDFPPSYPVETQAEYNEKLKKAKELLDDEARFYASGHRRLAHHPVEGGRVQLRFPRRPLPKDRKKGGPRKSGDTRTEESRARLLGPEAPWDARTQSVRSRQAAFRNASEGYDSRSKTHDLAERTAAAILAWRQAQPDGEYGFRVPRTKESLVEFGFDPKVAWLLVSRAAGRFFPVGGPARDEGPPSTRLAVTVGQLTIREDSDIPRLLLGVGTERYGRRGIEVERLEILDEASGESEIFQAKVLVARALRPSSPMSVLDVIDEAVAQTLEDREWSASTARARLVTKLGVTEAVSLGEHSSVGNVRPSAQKMDYRTFQNVTLDELPEALARVAIHKGPKTGRRLQQLPSGDTEMARKKTKAKAKRNSSLWWEGDPIFGASVPPRRTQYDQVEGQFGPGLAAPAVNRRNRGMPKRRVKRSGLSRKQIAAGFGGKTLQRAVSQLRKRAGRKGAARRAPKRTSGWLKFSTGYLRAGKTLKQAARDWRKKR